MAKKQTEWVKKSEFSELVQKMIERFEVGTGLHDNGYTVSYHRPDAIFFDVEGIQNPYIVARLIANCPEFYVEIEAARAGLWRVRMFGSDYFKRDIKRNLPLITEKISEEYPKLGEYVAVRLVD